MIGVATCSGRQPLFLFLYFLFHHSNTFHNGICPCHVQLVSAILDSFRFLFRYSDIQVDISRIFFRWSSSPRAHLITPLSALAISMLLHVRKVKRENDIFSNSQTISYSVVNVQFFFSFPPVLPASPLAYPPAVCLRSGYRQPRCQLS